MDLLAALGFTRPPWMRDGLCLEHPDVDWFDARQADEARAICARCLVQAECLTYALDNREQGVWGGTDEADRRAMRKAA